MLCDNQLLPSSLIGAELGIKTDTLISRWQAFFVWLWFTGMLCCTHCHRVWTLCDPLYCSLNINIALAMTFTTFN